MKFQRIIFLAMMVFSVCACTSIPELGTRAYVYERLNRVQFGNAPEQVIYLMDGQPSYVTSMAAVPDNYELWEYKVGNFLYAETAMILFKNGRVVALPKSGHELMQILHAGGVLGSSEFWSHKEA